MNDVCAIKAFNTKKVILFIGLGALIGYIVILLFVEYDRFKNIISSSSIFFGVIFFFVAILFLLIYFVMFVVNYIKCYTS